MPNSETDTRRGRVNAKESAMLKNSIILGGVAAVALGLSTMGAMAAHGGGGGFGGGGGGFHGGGGGGLHGGGGGFHGGGGHYGGIRGYRSGAYNHSNHFHGRRFAFYGPYADYGYGYGDDCYLRRGRWVCDYY
jgi:hypothetical protein